MGAKKLERSAAELFLETALKDGRATRQELSIRSITIDTSLQSRVATDPEHVKHLASLEDAGIDLRPVVVFRNPGPPRQTLLADGFHRVGARRHRKLTTVWAYVIEGTRTDAVQFSASANLENSKPTTREDRIKALEMLLAEPSLRQLPRNQLARMVGVSISTVCRHYASIHERLGLAVPDQVFVSRGGQSKSVKYGYAFRQTVPRKYIQLPSLANEGSKRDMMVRWADRILAEFSPAEIDELIGLLKAGREADADG
jgi:hypothetical protein